MKEGSKCVAGQTVQVRRPFLFLVFVSVLGGKIAISDPADNLSRRKKQQFNELKSKPFESLEWSLTL